ncbi:MAG: methylenetetrahydrofolate reductase [Oscillospiraceae bacterium]|nr:methylenetetrahydrofolate reductase [NAD(P)H] [Oscillospiraceae bacterium]
MKIAEMFGKGKTILSFEVFPPKKTGSIETVYNTIEQLTDLKPAYISVTYGAGGNLANNSTCEIASAIKNKYNTEAMAHVTCVNCTRSDLETILGRFNEAGIENILALRGDINPDIPPKTDFKYASELVTFIKEHGDFGISGACYPEVHAEAPDMITDILNLKKKVDAGAQTLVTQLFFENKAFYDFRDKVRIAGINVPISAGIMPVTNKNQIERMVTMCGASLPQKFTKMIQKYEFNQEALIDAGIAYAADQIVDLISNGVEGIHLYTMNNPYVARKITEIIGKLL